MHRCFALAFACLAATSVHAGELVALQAQSVDLGAFHGILYYTSEEDGYRVVTTIAEGEGLPVRFVATLLDSQSLTISVPGKVDEPSQEIEISRVGEKLLLRRKPANHTFLSENPQVLGK
jgi:hypothetical protein